MYYFIDTHKNIDVIKQNHKYYVQIINFLLIIGSILSHAVISRLLLSNKLPFYQFIIYERFYFLCKFSYYEVKIHFNLLFFLSL